MKTVYKYTLPASPGQFEIALPAGAQLLSVAGQQYSIVMWALVDTINHHEDRRFAVAWTGNYVPDNIKAYVGSCTIDALVYHVFELQ
jgi:hypothetical protein